MKSCSKKKHTQVLKIKPTKVKSLREWKFLVEEKDYDMKKINLHASFQVIENIKNKLTNRQKELFAKTCFGKFLELQPPKFSKVLIHHLLLRQLVCPDGESSLWFRIGGKECEFGLREFALITGLDCSECYPIESKLGTRIRDTYFNGKDRVSVDVLAQGFNHYEGNNDEDAVKLAQLYLLEGFLLSRDPRYGFRSFSIGLVDNARKFNKFPWGKYVYQYTIRSIKCAFEGRGEKYCRKSRKGSSMMFKSYVLKGFPYALQWWAYECIPSLSNEIVSRIDWKIPRMLNWKAHRIPNFQAFQKEIFSADALEVKSGLHPTEAEMNEKYLSYFLDKQSLKKRYAVNEEDKSPIEQAEKIVTNGENYQKSEDNEEFCMVKDDGNWKKKNRDKNAEAACGRIRRKRKHESKPEKLRKKFNEMRDTVNDEVTRCGSNIIAELRETMTETTKVRTNSTDSVCFIISEENNDDDNKGKNVVRRKRKRSVNDIPCFTVDLFEHPRCDEKKEFDQWIKVGLKRNNKKNKYSEVYNKIEPGFDFTVDTCYQKEWFFSLNETAQWLSGSHIDVSLHFLRKKKNDHPDLFKTRCTTTQSWFYQMLKSRYPKFQQDPENFEWNKQGTIQNTFKGTVPDYSLPWTDVDTIYIPVNVNAKHWVVAALDMKRHTIDVYDSYRAAKHDKEVMAACAPVSEMVPWLLKSAGFFCAREKLNNVTAPWNIRLVDGIPKQENGGDCGIFMVKFIEFLMQDMPLNKCTQEKMPFFRNKMAVELYAYGKKRRVDDH